jgi:hypothetical protein
MGLAGDPLSGAATADSPDAAELIRHAAVSGLSACIFMHRSDIWRRAFMPLVALIRLRQC